MRLGPRLNRYEKRELHQEQLKTNMGGSGIYIYENNSDADLTLPKPTESGIRTVGPRKRFQGDSYYMNWVGHPMNMLKLVEVVVPKMTPAEIQTLRENQEILLEQKMHEQKLILDQPDTITHDGKIERVVIPGQPGVKPLNDSTDPTQRKPVEVLLTEDPLDGLEIIVG